MRHRRIVRRRGVAVAVGGLLALGAGPTPLGRPPASLAERRAVAAVAVTRGPIVPAAGDDRRVGAAFTDGSAPSAPPASAAPRASGGRGRGPTSGRAGSTGLLVDVSRDIAMTARPGGGRVVGVLPARSRYYRARMIAWVQRVSRDGRFGRLAVPYSASGRSGWIPLDGLDRRRTRLRVLISLSRHRLELERRGRVVMGAPAGTGSPASPTPRGRYFVTDRVAFSHGGYLGRFAFGLSGIQPRLPAGWSGGDQLAIHGTNDPSSVGRSSSAGCIRVSDDTLDRLRRLIPLGTPVIVEP
jgi:lipoprotein-anchoring transpeptidase ErfK/SrfK